MPERMPGVLSITPGNFETPLGNLEKEEASTYLKFAAIKRNGRPEEIAPLYVALIDERLSYLNRHRHTLRWRLYRRRSPVPLRDKSYSN